MYKHSLYIPIITIESYNYTGNTDFTEADFVLDRFNQEVLEQVLSASENCTLIGQDMVHGTSHTDTGGTTDTGIH